MHESAELVTTIPERRSSRVSRSWAVVGGGMLGMTIAWRLAQQGYRVTLFESRTNAGGLADSWRIGDITWDRHYHVTLMSDLLVRELLKELRLDDQMEWVETKTGFFTDGQLYSMSNTVEFLRFPPLSMIDKLRLGGTIFYGSRLKNWKKLEQISVEDWLTKLSGRRTFEKMWLPLLRSKLGECWRDTSAAFIWATIARMYAARRSGLKKEMFGYVRGGYAVILKRFEEQLRQAGVDIRCGTPVLSVESGPEGSVMVGTRRDEEFFDRAVTTVPSPVVSRVLPQLTDRERQLHEGIRYHGLVCASLLLKQPLSHYYVTNITDGRVPFTAVIEMSALVDRQQLGGHSLIYLPRYATPDDDIFIRTDAEIQSEFVSALERMYPHFSSDDVVDFRVSRVRHVFALPTLGYSRQLAPVATSIPNIFAVNSSHIVNGTLNVNETVRLANDFVRQHAPRCPSER
ncbi:MAG: NAD(P)/FAD-dependent oxidoreductase [Planctomycetaceae bacterium]